MPYRLTFLLIFDYSHICPIRGVPHTPTLRIPLKLQPKPRVLGFFDYIIYVILSSLDYNPSNQ